MVPPPLLLGQARKFCHLARSSSDRWLGWAGRIALFTRCPLVNSSFLSPCSALCWHLKKILSSVRFIKPDNYKERGKEKAFNLNGNTKHAAAAQLYIRSFLNSIAIVAFSATNKKSTSSSRPSPQYPASFYPFSFIPFPHRRLTFFLLPSSGLGALFLLIPITKTREKERGRE